jgi:hypothetical protein
MKTYFVYRAATRAEQPYVFDSPEVVACEIVRFAACEYLPRGHYVAVEAESPEMTYHGLHSTPLFSVQLDKARVTQWHDQVSPVVEGLSNLSDTIDQAQNNIAESLDNLIGAAGYVDAFRDLDCGENIQLDHAFAYIEAPSLSFFCERVEKMFDVVHLGVPSRV